jgi:flavin-dependent dehydrogenase
VGGGPAGLAAAIGLARQAGFRVDVFDARQNPASDSHSSRDALLVALGENACVFLVLQLILLLVINFVGNVVVDDCKHMCG